MKHPMQPSRLALHAARHSHGSPDWYTPKPFVEAARATMGGIDLDPASDRIANRVVKARTFYSVKHDGLKRAWNIYGGTTRVFLNPPGGLVADFWRRLDYCWGRDLIGQAIWIGYSLEQLQTLQQVGATFHPLDFSMCVPDKRIAFVENAARQRERLAKIDKENRRRRRAGEPLMRRSETAVSPSHANYIVYFGRNTAAFRLHFENFGKVTRA